MAHVLRISFQSSSGQLEVDARTHAKKVLGELPEAQLITPLAYAAPTRAGQMVAAEAAAPREAVYAAVHSPGPSSSADSGAGERQRKLLDQCRNCPLWKYATQAVPGEGPISARLMLVGEQPGDQEDLAGRPFVGPAGQLLDRALSAAGYRSRRGVCHQCSEAFQVRIARQAPSAQEARRA